MTETQKPYTARQLADKTGYSVRFFQDLAKTVEWARQPRGEGGRIFFEPAGFQKWWECEGAKLAPKEQDKWHPPTNATGSSGAKSRGRGKRSEDPSRRAIRELLTNGSTHG